jgi:2-dehydro-3-deoxy-L-rhamnonate dehydrogenase (NAD+)
VESSHFFSLHNQVAAITGGGQGLGEGIAQRLHQAGAKVAVLDLNLERAQKVASTIDGLAVQVDVSKPESVETAHKQVREKLGQITILVNSAGITGRTVPTWELTDKEFDDVYAVNLRGTFLLCRAVIGDMLANGYGRIVNIASIAGKEGNPTLVPYSSTKAGVIGFTKAFAKEVAGKGDITVNSISPAVVRTAILDTVAQKTIDYMVSRIPMGRTGKVEEIAALVHYLVSSEASFTTGQCYDISGGRATY